MTNAQQRFALLTGVSISALGLAAPAAAATHAGVGHSLSGPIVNDTLTICLPAANCEFGVANSGSGAVSAIVDAVANGRIAQIATATGAAPAGDLTLEMINDGEATIAASASAQAALGAATADAAVLSAVIQSGHGPGDIVLDLDNGGSLAIDATALAEANTAAAHAVNSFAINQSATAYNGNAEIDLTNSGTIAIAANAAAVAAASGTSAPAGSALASAYVHNAIYQHGYAPAGDIDIDASNTGEIDIAAIAAATGGNAFAPAQIEYGVSQVASALDGDAHAGFVNDGVINETAAAAADGTAGLGFAQAVLTSALFQLASAGGDADVSFKNDGTFNALASAAANGATDAIALAFLNSGIEQFAIAGGNADATLTNSGTIDLEAKAAANVDTGNATAIGFVSHGISQHAYAGSDATISLDNSGLIHIGASGDAHSSDGRAFGEAGIFRGIWQSALATGAASATLANSGTVEISAEAHGSAAGTSGVGRAVAVIAPAIFQLASGASGSFVSLDNSGTIDVRAIAEATGVIGAPAIAQADGIVQIAGSGTAEFINSGDVAVTASAKAIAAGSSAFVGVHAVGVLQQGHGGINRMDNSGSLSVQALASAQGAGGAESGSATGLYVRGDAAELEIDNSGDVDVEALGVAPGFARMGAIGIRVDAIGGSAATATQPALISGSLDNSGSLKVVASAAGGGPLVSATISGGFTTFPQSSASAIGISSYAGANNATFTNSGTISVDAVTPDGGTANAYGILIQGNGTGVPPTADDLFTFTNDGGVIVVRESVDGGDTWRRGMAIDVANAPNASVINLIGDGAIYGDIAVAAGDSINVADGTTYFDGIINPAFLPAGGITPASLDSGLAGIGSLNIGGGGNLILADPRLTGDPAMYDGPAYAFVDTFTVTADGTITFELQPAGAGAQPVGSYPQVFADVANLDGTLVAGITPPGGLFADSYTYDNVIDANVRNGTFDTCVVGAPYASSILLDAACTYDAGANVDLSVTRIGFDAVAGVNANGAGVGQGLECIYDTSLTGGIADLLGDLFLFTDPVNYNIALNQLSGSAYANYLQSFPSLGVHYNDLLDHATNCEVPALAGSVLECRASSPIHVWGQLDYQWRKADGDNQAGTTKSRRFTGLMGVDANVGQAAILGVSAGYVTNHTRDNQFGDKIDADGMQVGAYGVFDPGAFYVKAMTTYSWYGGDSDRNINFAGLAPGATFAGSPSGDPDVNMWTFGVHGGYRIGLAGNSVLTPYLDYDHVNAKLKSFTESGLDGANLTVEGGRSKHSFLTGGAKWATQLGGVVPEVNLGYRYRFGNKRSSFTAAFLGDTDCDFDIVSAGQKRGTFLAGLSVGGKMGPFDLRIGYEGEFNSDVTSHSGNFKFVLPLGGHAAPPPPAPEPVAPPVIAPPPVEVAPPAPETLAPPPPPAPVERGERGQ